MAKPMTPVVDTPESTPEAEVKPESESSSVSSTGPVMGVLNPRARQDAHQFGDLVFKHKEPVSMTQEQFEEVQQHKTFQDDGFITTVVKTSES